MLHGRNILWPVFRLNWWSVQGQQRLLEFTYLSRSDDIDANVQSQHDELTL